LQYEDGSSIVSPVARRLSRSVARGQAERDWKQGKYVNTGAFRPEDDWSMCAETHTHHPIHRLIAEPDRWSRNLPVSQSLLGRRGRRQRSFSTPARGRTADDDKSLPAPKNGSCLAVSGVSPWRRGWVSGDQGRGQMGSPGSEARVSGTGWDPPRWSRRASRSAAATRGGARAVPDAVAPAFLWRRMGDGMQRVACGCLIVRRLQRRSIE
jgi:hypothetical protein